MEGVLYIPPDRGTIIGRALWKARFVVAGVPRDAKLITAATSRSVSQQQVQRGVIRSASIPSESLYLSIYKNKGDQEPIQEHAFSSITDCQVQMLAHRKQGPILPTLVISISPDPLTDKLRKRRSSRTAGLTSTKECSPSTLWFRSGEDSHHNHQKHVLQEWCRFILPLIQQPLNTNVGIGSSTGLPGPLSPITPASPTFINPFSPSTPRSREASDAFFQQPQPPHTQRPGSDHHNVRSGPLNHKASTQTNQTGQSRSSRDRDRPMTFSENQSLRSRRSDLSHTSSTVPPHVMPGYNTGSASSTNNSNAGSAGHGANGFSLPHFHTRPADLPSPATTIGEFQPPSDFIEGWTSAQGRASTVSSPIRGRESISSQPSQPSAKGSVSTQPPTTVSSSSPPVPRETILDRAFQMRIIPGSDREMPGEEKLSSLARYEALMREHDDRRRLKLAQTVPDLSKALAQRCPAQLKSGFDVDDSDSDKDSDAVDSADEAGAVGADQDAGSGDDDSSADERIRRRRSGRKANASYLQQLEYDHPASSVQIAPHARRALEFITGRHEETPSQSSRSTRPVKSVQSPPSSSSALRMQEALARGAIGIRSAGNASYEAETIKTFDSGYSSSQSYYPSSSSSAILQKQQQQQPPQLAQEILRPQTGYSRRRPAIAQRTHSQSHLETLNGTNRLSLYQQNSGMYQHTPSPFSPPPPVPQSPEISTASATSRAESGRGRSSAGAVSSSSSLHRAVTTAVVNSIPSPNATASLSVAAASLSGAPAITNSTSEKRLSSNSVKRLSFTEFTKRLSNSTTSLMLGQPNASGGSTGNNTALGQDSSTSATLVDDTLGHHHRSTSRTGPPPPPPPAERCGWRGSVGVFGNEGGFL